MTLPGWVAGLENRFDVQAKKISWDDLAKFRADLNKVKVDVGVLQQHQFMVLTDSAMHKLEEEISMLDLTGDSPKKKKKKGEKIGKDKREDPDSEEERRVKKKVKNKAKK